MTAAVASVFLAATLSVWDYPSRQAAHERLRAQLIEASREGDRETIVETCRKGVSLLPDDPTWAYNHACALAHGDDAALALDELARAIDLGFIGSAKLIAEDRDWAALAADSRFVALVGRAREREGRSVSTGPLAASPALARIGGEVELGATNLTWDFNAGCFEARIALSGDFEGGNAGDLYMNRDGGHSTVVLADFPGLTSVRLDEEGRARKQDLDQPNILFPLPLFGNSSRAFTDGPFWRSVPRSMMTIGARQMKAYERMYRSNQVWVFPANADCPPAGTNGDVFAAVTPYWIVTAGRSWSDLPYLHAALEASRSFAPEVKRYLVAHGLLAPTVQVLLRKSLRGVVTEADYLSPKAHPTCFPADGLDCDRLRRAATVLQTNAVPPLAALQVKMKPPSVADAWPECVFSSAYACSFVLRADDDERSFVVLARGGSDYACVQTHGLPGAVGIERIGRGAFLVTVYRRRIPVCNRVDVAVFARRQETRWGAPSFLSFATVDPEASYSDPFLTPRGDERPGDRPASGGGT